MEDTYGNLLSLTGAGHAAVRLLYTLQPGGLASDEDEYRDMDEPRGREVE